MLAAEFRRIAGKPARDNQNIFVATPIAAAIAAAPMAAAPKVRARTRVTKERMRGRSRSAVRRWSTRICGSGEGPPLRLQGVRGGGELFHAVVALGVIAHAGRVDLQSLIRAWMGFCAFGRLASTSAWDSSTTARMFLAWKKAQSLENSTCWARYAFWGGVAADFGDHQGGCERGDQDGHVARPGVGVAGVLLDGFVRPFDGLAHAGSSATARRFANNPRRPPAESRAPARRRRMHRSAAWVIPDLFTHDLATMRGRCCAGLAIATASSPGPLSANATHAVLRRQDLSSG